jgi:CheY-like chemotaxis protein
VSLCARQTILIVDDNAAVRRLFRAALEGGGFRVLETGDGRATLALLATERPDLILQDLRLPDMDGLALVSRIREHTGNTVLPIIAVSGLVLDQDEARIARAGFTDFLAKPVSIADLLNRVTLHLPVRGSEPVQTRRVLAVDDDPLRLGVLAFQLTSPE